MDITMPTAVNPARPFGATFSVTAIGALLAGAVWLSGCASTPPPTAQLAVAASAIAHATAAGAAEAAPVEMGQARDKLTRANTALAAKDNDTALALAQQAALDAQLAEAKGEAARSRKASDALGEAGQALREEMSRKVP
jgi:uncharacterized lipoprotein YmbA